MGKTAHYFRQPFIRYRNPWAVIGIPTVTVAFVLSVFEPFYFRLSGLGQLWCLLGFVLVAALGSSIVYYIFPILFRRFYSEERWTMGKEWLHYLFFLIVVSVLATIFDMQILQRGTYARPVWNIAVDMEAGVTIGLIPVVLLFLIARGRMQKSELAEVGRLNRVLQQRIGKEEHRTGTIILSGTTKESVCAEPENIIYLEVSGNYVDVCYVDPSGTTRHKLLRSTIKQMEEALRDYEGFCRTHRAFIVNVHKIVSVNSYASGYKLLLSGTPDAAYVSRNYLKSFKEKMK